MQFSWYIAAIFTIIFWGTADLFYKKGTDPNNKYSYLRIIIIVGFVMGLQATWELFALSFEYDFFNIIKYFPVSFMYILSMALGYVGLRYLEVSINSPVSNTSGAMAALFSFIVLGKTMGGWELLAVGMITIGLVVLAVIEKNLAEEERKQKKINIDKKYKIGAIALIFPILYAIIDSMGTFLDDVYLSNLMSPEEALISYELTFLICGVLAFIYVILIKKQEFKILKEKDRALAAIFETAGQFFYVYALDTNSVVVAPMIASYSIVAILLGRIFLKEKLTIKQYIVITIVMTGIFILGFFE